MTTEPSGPTGPSEPRSTPPPVPQDGSSGPPGPGWWLASDGNYYPPQGPAQALPPYGYGYGYVAPPRTNGLAIASLVLGIIWIYWIGSVLALVFGYVARSQIKKSGGTQTGGGLALAGIVLGWIGVAIGVLLAIVLVVVGLNGGFDDDGINSDPVDGVCNSDRYLQDPDC